MPAAFGVSRAILDNVIFCHQEDNNWPLGEPASLKKKFDDIFEATRYTKALENIKSIRKERAVNLKVAKAELDGLKVDRQRAHAVKEKKEKLEKEIGEKMQKLEKLNRDIEDLTVANKVLYDKALRFRETVQKAESLEEKKLMHEENLSALRSSMTPLSSSEEELQGQKDGFQSHLGDLKRKQDSLKNQVNSKRSATDASEKRLNQRLSEKGALDNEKRQHERALKTRAEVVRRVAEDLSIAGLDLDTISDQQIEDFSRSVEEEVASLRRTYEQLKTEFARKEEDGDNRVRTLRDTANSHEAKRSALQEDVKRAKERIKRMQDDLDLTMSGAVDVETARRENSAQVSRLHELTHEQSGARHDDSIRDKNAEIRSLDDRREDLTNELNGLNRQADFRAKLGLNKKAAVQKGDEIQSILSRNGEMLRRLLEKAPDVASIETDIEVVVSRKEKELASLEAAFETVKGQLQRLESVHAIAQATVAEKQKQVEELRGKINAALAGEYESLDESIKSCQSEVDYSRSQIALYESMSSFIKNLKVHIKDKHICLGCNRSVTSSDMPSIEAHISDMMQKAQPAKLQEYKDDLVSWEEQLAAFQDLKSSEAHMDALLNDEIVEHSTTVEKTAFELQRVKIDSEDHRSRFEARKNEMRELNQCKRIAADVARLSSEKLQLDRDVAALESDLRSSGSTRTGDDVQQEIDECAEKMKKLKREVQTLQQEKEALRVSITNQERAVHRAELAFSKASQEKEKMQSAQKRLDDTKAEMEEQVGRLKSIDNDLAVSSEPLRRAEEELSRLKSEASNKQSAALQRSNQASDSFRQLRESMTNAQRFVEQRGEQRLQDCQRAIDELQEDMREARTEIAEVQEKIDGIEKDLNESRATERNISDNLRFIRLQRDVHAIDDELRAMDLEEASRAHREWDGKYTTSKRRENDMNGQAAHLNGEITSLRAQIDSRNKELREEYKDVHKSFTKKLVEVKAEELAQGDTKIYQDALNAAIMRFHSIKMEEINEILNDLWSKTYKGSDIDTIKIRADSEGAGARTYNYRVVMVKDTIEMDMRGRCSAGQKCLASILIRMALADSFSENCGIMALDEPTTNLDEYNIQALASSLGALIEDRRKNSNFQLIIITHDVNFLSQIAHSSGGIDRYFRVERDDRYRSRIIQETRLP